MRKDKIQKVNDYDRAYDCLKRKTHFVFVIAITCYRNINMKRKSKYKHKKKDLKGTIV